MDKYPKDVTIYKGFSIEILVGKNNLYFYRIHHKDMTFPIESDMGEESEGLATDAAMEFIEEHLI